MKDSQQAIEAKRNHILDVAASVFAENGFHTTTIRDVAKRAGVADGTIYNYFYNKTALLFAILDRMKQVALEQEDFAALADTDLRGFLVAFFRQPLTAFQVNDFALFRVVLSEIMVNAELRARYQRDIMEPTLALATPYLRMLTKHTPLELDKLDFMVRAMSGLMLGLMLQYVMGDEVIISQWDTLPEQLADLFLDRMGGEAS